MGIFQKWTTKDKSTFLENKTQNKFYINKNIKKEKLIKEQPFSVSLESKKKKYYFKWKIVYVKYI